MEMFDDLDKDFTNLETLKRWARANEVDWVETKARNHKFRAATKINGDIRLIGVGRTLFGCLWMAYEIFNASK